ncbi:MAG: manganese efflux pump MntP family protein [Victivallaceae bacterium]|nr:manganese efflux pump MntP family protein [Victivallaceae bacterium]
MKFIEMMILAFGVSLDAFSVSVSGSLSGCHRPWRNAGLAALFFGGFQILMPLAGGLLGKGFGRLLASVDHYVAFSLLVAVGGKMIWEAFFPKKEEKLECERFFNIKNMFVMAVATSIDAAVVGASIPLAGYGYVDVLVPTAIAMGIITAAMSVSGVWLGRFFGSFFSHHIGALGGIALIAIGVKILISHICA